MLKNYSDKEISQAFSFFEANNKKFQSIKNDLAQIYGPLKNGKKLMSLFHYWLYSFEIIHQVYGDEGIRCFCKDKNSSFMGFSYQFEFKMYRDFDPKRSERWLKSNFFSYLGLLIINFFKFNIFLPGANLSSFKFKLINRVSKIIFKNINSQIDILCEEKINSILDIYFKDFSKSDKNLIKQKLPHVFKSKKVKYPFIKNELILKGSAAAFLNFRGYENIFLLDNKLVIEGYQHGGGYDLFEVDYFSYFEKKMCDEFYGWGFSKKNVKQFKFKKRKIKKVTEGSKKILWIEDTSLPIYYGLVMPNHYKNIHSNLNKQFVYDELKKNEIQYTNLMHPVKPSKAYDKFRKNDFYLSQANDGAENIVSANDICIFDSIGSTFIHFCIENEIIFRVVLSLDDYKFMSIKAKQWIDVLRKNQFAFIIEEDENCLGFSLENINEKKTIPNQIKKYNTKNFFVL